MEWLFRGGLLWIGIFIAWSLGEIAKDMRRIADKVERPWDLYWRGEAKAEAASKDTGGTK
jgi:hypothetical protein